MYDENTTVTEIVIYLYWDDCYDPPCVVREGTIAPEFGNLKKLKVLRLDSNQLRIVLKFTFEK